MAMFDPHSGKLQQVREVVRFTPLQQDVLKFLALMLMVFDHANRALGLHEPVLLLLGRGGVSAVRPAVGVQPGVAACPAGAGDPAVDMGRGCAAGLLAGNAS